jgi:hypothetical protein
MFVYHFEPVVQVDRIDFQPLDILINDVDQDLQLINTHFVSFLKKIINLRIKLKK